MEKDDLWSYWRRLKAGKKRPLQYVLSVENAGEEQHLASLLRLDERTDPLSFSLVRLRHILAVLDVSEDRWCINVIRSQSVCAPATAAAAPQCYFSSSCNSNVLHIISSRTVCTLKRRILKIKLTKTSEKLKNFSQYSRNCCSHFKTPDNI